MFPTEDGEGWYYIAEGTWDLLGIDPYAPIYGVPADGRIRMVAGGGFEPRRDIDHVQVVDFAIAQNAQIAQIDSNTGQG